MQNGFGLPKMQTLQPLVRMQVLYRWYNTSSSNMSAKINIIADNKSGITNGKSVGEQSGGWGGSGGLFKVTLNQEQMILFLMQQM